MLKPQNKVYISDAAIRNAVLMKDDITNDSTELGIIAETAVFKHVNSFAYSDYCKVGYFRGDSKNKEIDIVVKYNSNMPPIMIEVKYRENPKISETELIVEKQNGLPNLVVTKNTYDYGLKNYKNGKQIYKIPAPVFLYLLGYVENQKYVNK